MIYLYVTSLLSYTTLALVHPSFVESSNFEVEKKYKNTEESQSLQKTLNVDDNDIADSSIESIQLDLQEVPVANQSISEYNEDSGDNATEESNLFKEDKITGTQQPSKKNMV